MARHITTLNRSSRKWLNPPSYANGGTAGGSICWNLSRRHYKVGGKWETYTDARLSIRDCYRHIDLDLCIQGKRDRRDSIRKLDLLIGSLSKMRDLIADIPDRSAP